MGNRVTSSCAMIKSVLVKHEVRHRVICIPSNGQSLRALHSFGVNLESRISGFHIRAHWLDFNRGWRRLGRFGNLGGVASSGGTWKPG